MVWRNVEKGRVKKEWKTTFKPFCFCSSTSIQWRVDYFKLLYPFFSWFENEKTWIDDIIFLQHASTKTTRRQSQKRSCTTTISSPNWRPSMKIWKQQKSCSRKERESRKIWIKSFAKLRKRKRSWLERCRLLKAELLRCVSRPRNNLGTIFVKNKYD